MENLSSLSDAELQRRFDRALLFADPVELVACGSEMKRRGNR